MRRRSMHGGVGDFRSVSRGSTTHAKPSVCWISGAKPISVECWMPYARGAGFRSLTILRICRPKSGLRQFGTEKARWGRLAKIVRVRLCSDSEDAFEPVGAIRLSRRPVRIASAAGCGNGGSRDAAYFCLSASRTAAMRLGSAASGSMPARSTCNSWPTELLRAPQPRFIASVNSS